MLEWVVVTLAAGGAGGKRKPNTLPLSMECINIKYDSLASSLFSRYCEFNVTVCVLFPLITAEITVCKKKKKKSLGDGG